MILNPYLGVCKPAIFCLKFKLKYPIAHNKPFPATSGVLAPLVKKRCSKGSHSLFEIFTEKMTLC